MTTPSGGVPMVGPPPMPPSATKKGVGPSPPVSAPGLVGALVGSPLADRRSSPPAKGPPSADPRARAVSSPSLDRSEVSWRSLGVAPGQSRVPAPVKNTVPTSARPVLKPRGEPRQPPPEPPAPAAELRSRADRLTSSDPVGAARALVELGLYEERLNHDRQAARKCYEAA
ncbi:MAG: hypothetical protein WKG00_39305, partial [Polyangiaceae bacterium]